MTNMTKRARETRSRNLFNGRVKRIVAVFIDLRICTDAKTDEPEVVNQPSN